MKTIVKHTAFGLCAASLVFQAACSRSDSYRKDQGYYRQDTDYANRAGNATARADRFGQPKKRLYVLPFYNATPLGGDELGVFSADELMREIRSSGKAVVPEDVRAGSTSRDFFAGDKVRLGALVREGKKMGVSMIIVGRIKKVVYRTKGDEVGLFRQKKSLAAVDLEMRLFDIGNQRELLFDEKSADSEQSSLNVFGGGDADPKSQRVELVRLALRNGMKMFSTDATRALEKIMWEGRIAKIAGGLIYINAGRATGLNVGDLLKVVTRGEEIYDPTTNAYLGRSQGQPKGTLEIVDYMGRDASVARVHSGGNFVESDAVQLY